MRDLTRLPHALDPDARVCRIIVETPKGRRHKYGYDPESDLFELVKVLPDGMSFPTDFGFVPSTLSDDGAPLDVMVLCDEPSAVGALIRVRLLGVIKAEQAQAGKVLRNDRLLAIPAPALPNSSAKTLDDLEPALVENLSRFWVNKAKAEGEDLRIIGLGGPSAAIELICKATKAAARPG
jgi:inorganic pyrophosphatase